MAAESSAMQAGVGLEIYGIKLDIFEGPLDLLLFLIRKDEIDIYDIPIADITRQFLEYVEIIQTLDLEKAGDFLVMAATLMKIKSRMMLPVDPEADEEGEDPREELVRRLLEYQQFKEVAGWLEDEQEAHRDVFYRGAALDMEGVDEEDEDPLAAYRSVSLFDLMAAFKAVLIAAPRINFHEVERVEVSTEERMEAILEMLAEKRQVLFFDLVAGSSRMVMIVTFVALLELIKSGEAMARQNASGGDIWIYKPEAVTPAVVEKAETVSGSEDHV